jgi:redox-sensitive bicupin YhaK (pirin superfamily)
MMLIHKSDSRGTANFGWLNSRHTFSFGDYYEPSRMGFGKLRVLNDDTVAAAQGFGTHPHRDMEIISIPLSGSLQHKDSEGNEQLITKGEVQIMSAGTGVYHSEYNASSSEEVKFLQIWIMPKLLQMKPRYEQKSFLFQPNVWTTVVAPEGKEGGVSINQDAYFSIIPISQQEVTYQTKIPGQGIYLFVLEGEIILNGTKINRRDGVELTEEHRISIKAEGDAEVLLIEIPLN